MLVKMCRDWRCYLRGDVAELGLGVCVELIRRGICTEVTEPDKEVEPVEVASMAPAETAIKRKRGRPRKYPERYTDGN